MVQARSGASWALCSLRDRASLTTSKPTPLGYGLQAGRSDRRLGARSFLQVEPPLARRAGFHRGSAGSGRQLAMPPRLCICTQNFCAACINANLFGENNLGRFWALGRYADYAFYAGRLFPRAPAGSLAACISKSNCQRKYLLETFPSMSPKTTSRTCSPPTALSWKQT